MAEIKQIFTFIHKTYAITNIKTCFFSKHLIQENLLKVSENQV
jgi:hypothetical protein